MGSKAKTQEIREFILEKLDKGHSHDISKLVQHEFGLTKQGAYYHLRSLVSEGVLSEKGQRKNKTYREIPLKEWAKEYSLDGLSEHEVWEEIVSEGIIPDLDKDKAGYTLFYGFTEMLNNAIDHSEGSKASVFVQVFRNKIALLISDDGFGIFKKIKREANLEDEKHAILVLLKGKYTSMPESHSGQGIFFTSKVFDFFDIESGGICFMHLIGSHNDWLVDIENQASGTNVLMILDRESELNMEDVFAEYTAEDGDFAFNLTIVPVRKLSLLNENVVSRSQAKRLMIGLQKFDEVYLDFTDVNKIGQAFADQIFRVWAKQNPNVNLDYQAANESVVKMIVRAEAEK